MQHESFCFLILEVKFKFKMHVDWHKLKYFKVGKLAHDVEWNFENLAHDLQCDVVQ